MARAVHGDKECPVSGVTKSGRVWWKVPESNARSVNPTMDHTASLDSSMHTFEDAD